MKKPLVLSVILLIFISITLLATWNILFENDIPAKEGEKISTSRLKEVKTEIGFLNGTLNISTGTLNKLYTGDYKYQKSEWKPQISYSEEEGTGYLNIVSKDEREERKFDTADNNKWDIVLNRDIKNDLNIRMGAGTGKFDLEDSNLKRFDFQMAAGEVDINLKNTSVPDLRIKAIAGKATVDLTGAWHNDLHASITGGVGELSFILPESTGTKMEITGILANIYAPGFIKNGHTYTNSTFGSTKETLYIEIFGGIGEIDVRMKE